MAELRTTAAQILDRKFSELQSAAVILRQRPVKGWVQAIRSALGMSVTALAERLGVKHSTVVAYEQAELAGRIQINTLRRIAVALDAELIVALVPRQPIRERLRERAHEIAREEMNSAVQSMRLENQEVDPALTNEQFQTLVESLLREPKKLWR